MFETSFEEIQRLRRQSVMAYKTGEYARGVHLAEQACHLGKSAFGTHHPNYATLLNILASLYSKMGRWGERCRDKLFWNLEYWKQANRLLTFVSD